MPKLTSADIESTTKSALKRDVKRSGIITEKEYVLRKLNLWDVEQSARQMAK